MRALRATRVHLAPPTLPLPTVTTAMRQPMAIHRVVERHPYADVITDLPGSSSVTKIP